MSYRIKAVFATLQGEGAQAGRPAIFVRFTGCNLWSGQEAHRERDADRSLAQCARWCDTDFVGGETYSAAEILQRVREAHLQIRHVVLSGGEPMLQLDSILTDELHSAGYTLALETNGTHAVPPHLVDWITVSPKCLDDRWLQRRGDELKLIYPAISDPEGVRINCAFDHYFLQAQDGPAQAEHLQRAIAFVQQHAPWRLSVQTHKLLGLP